VFVDVERSCELFQKHVSLWPQAWCFVSFMRSSSHFRETNRCVLLSTQVLVYGSCYDEVDHTLAVLKAGRVALIDMKGDGRMAMKGDGRIARILEARIVKCVYCFEKSASQSSIRMWLSKLKGSAVYCPFMA